MNTSAKTKSGPTILNVAAFMVHIFWVVFGVICNYELTVALITHFQEKHAINIPIVVFLFMLTGNTIVHFLALWRWSADTKDWYEQNA